MQSQPGQIAQLRFVGPPYEGNGLDDCALGEMRKFGLVLTRVARAIWRDCRGAAAPADIDRAVRFADFRNEVDAITVAVKIRPEYEEVFSKSIDLRALLKTLNLLGS